MKTYFLHLLVEGNDNLVASYSSLEKLRDRFARDAYDFLEGRIKREWYISVTCEDENGDTQDFSFSEVRDGVE